MPFDQAESGTVTLWDAITEGQTLKAGQNKISEITFKSKFTKTPKILIGIITLQMDFNNMKYAISVKSISTEKVQIELDAITDIFKVEISYLACVDDYITITNDVFDNQQYNTLTKIYTYTLYSKQNYNRNAMCFPFGFQSETTNNEFEYYVKVNSLDSQQYLLQVLSGGLNLKLIQINCIEYYEESNGAYKMPADFQYFTFQNIIGNVPASQNVQINQSFGTGTLISFFGLVGYNSHSFDINLGIQLLQSPQLIIKLSSGYAISQARIGYFQYQMINCKESHKINNINNPLRQNCVSICPPGYFMESTSSINKCQSCMTPQQYVLNNICFDSQPDNTYCDTSRICQSCKIPCKYCDKTLKNCLSCTASHYLVPA